MSQFDPATFIDATITEPTTRRPPLPAGREYIAVVGEPKPREWQGKKDPTKSGIAVDVPLEIDLTAYPDVQEKIGVPRVVVQDSIMLDTTPTGMIDNAPGKNGKMRRYRDALDLNKPGDQFSFRAMQGRQLRVRIKHREHEGDLFEEVEAVAKA